MNSKVENNQSNLIRNKHPPYFNILSVFIVSDQCNAFLHGPLCVYVCDFYFVCL